MQDHHTGLPRGRVTHPKSGHIVIHGDDVPIAVPDRFILVKAHFRLIVVKVTPMSTEREKMLADELEQFFVDRDG